MANQGYARLAKASTSEGSRSSAPGGQKTYMEMAGEVAGQVAGQVVNYMRGTSDPDQKHGQDGGNKVRSNSDLDPEWDKIPRIVSLGGWQLRVGNIAKLTS